MFLWDNVILVLQQRFFEALFPSYSRLAAKFLQVVRVEGQTMSNDVCVHGFYMLQGVRVEGQTMSNDVCVHGFYSIVSTWFFLTLLCPPVAFCLTFVFSIARLFLKLGPLSIVFFFFWP
ncbi:uncharacterized protein [Elaeis guineensis]|uniref:uncharacterized protein isoform X1 n=1 Tax=Elaeis guineensis var. tenera TaxID=51953 RepID=UPI003C6D0385